MSPPNPPERNFLDESIAEDVAAVVRIVAVQERALPPGFLSLLDPQPAAIEPIAGNSQTTGRRAALARWITRHDNPLTARVMVNRIWQKLFGEGIVRSVDYFGTRGEGPSHLELLDHLATRFRQNGWSQKQLIRSLVLSRTYRLSSANDAHAMRVDPDNRLLWRMNRQRLDAEALRDSLLAISGELISSDGGPALVLEEEIGRAHV